jgi:ubiquitin carboxyl-terminal hydrolase 14
VKDGLETGYYELIGTVTHLGKSVDSGHYMAWIKENEEDWTKYDDNTVYQQPSDKVLQLRGGQPNLEIAYILLFRKVYARVEKEEKEKAE